MIAEGADIIDIGAESTRPYGSEPISADEELKRLQPVLAEIVALGVPVSIDSMKSAVVAWALDQGAVIANDVWGLQRDPGMAALVAARRVPVIIMHNRDSADPAIDIMKDIAAFFARSLEIAAKAGISPDNIVLDPGIGFGKTPEQSMTALARLRRTQIIRPAATGRRLAQALHQHGDAVGAASASRRLDCRASDCGTSAARGSSGPMMWRKPCRRCGWRRQSGTANDRYDLHHRRRHPCPPWRDGTRDRGWAAFRDRSRTVRRSVGILAHRPPCRHRVLFQRGRDRDGGLQEHQLQAAGARGRRRCRRHTGRISAHQRRQGHRSQAARADRCDLRRRRRGPDPHAASASHG